MLPLSTEVVISWLRSGVLFLVWSAALLNYLTALAALPLEKTGEIL